MTTEYADVAYGATYFAERLRTGAWDDATSADRTKALKMATQAIDSLPFAGSKADDAQARQFPRGADVVVPDPILKACCELALALLDDVDPNLEIENLANSRQGMSDARIERDTSYAQEHIRAGIPSIQAWMLLKPFLRDERVIGLDR